MDFPFRYFKINILIAFVSENNFQVLFLHNILLEKGSRVFDKVKSFDEIFFRVFFNFFFSELILNILKVRIYSYKKKGAYNNVTILLLMTSIDYFLLYWSNLENSQEIFFHYKLYHHHNIVFFVHAYFFIRNIKLSFLIVWAFSYGLNLVSAVKKRCLNYLISVFFLIFITIRVQLLSLVFF